MNNLSSNITYVKWLGFIDSDTMVIGAKLQDGKILDGFGNDVEWVKKFSNNWFCNTENWKIITEEEYNIEKNKYECSKK